MIHEQTGITQQHLEVSVGINFLTEIAPANEVNQGHSATEETNLFSGLPVQQKPIRKQRALWFGKACSPEPANGTKTIYIHWGFGPEVLCNFHCF